VPTPAPDRDLVHACWRVSLVSIACTLASSAAALTIGAFDDSQVMIALGCVGIVDAVGSAALVAHFHEARAARPLSARREQLAHRTVALGLVAVGTVNGAVAIARLATGAHGGGWAGAVLAAVSLIVLVALARTKRALGRRVGSRALVADGHLSAVGAAESAVAVVGVAVSELVGLGWVDGAAALVVSGLAALVGIAEWRGERHPS